MLTTRILRFSRIFNISNGNSDKVTGQTVQDAIIFGFNLYMRNKKQQKKKQQHISLCHGHIIK